MFAGAATLNHLLAQNNEALARLMRFAGKTVRFDIAPFCFAYSILPDGTLRDAASDATADAVCVIALSLLPRLALKDEKAYRDIATFGDAALLFEIFSLSRILRWDAEKDLSRITGNAGAQRIMRTLRNKRDQLHDVVLNISKTAAEYCTEEHSLLAKSRQVEIFIQQVNTLRDEVSRLEQRIEQYAARDH